MTVEHGNVEMRRHDDGRVEIFSAPPTASMSLELLAQSDPHLVRVRGREISLAGQCVYRVTGWDDLQACLLLEKVS